jgi:hypothetical protein
MTNNATDNSTLIDEIAAEIELGLPDAAQRTAVRLKKLELLVKDLKDIGLVKKINIDPHDSSTLEIVGLSTAASTQAAYGGLLYGISALSYGLKISQSDILDSWQTSRVKVGDIDYSGIEERIRWKQFSLAYTILKILLNENRNQLILLDLPLFISRREEATIFDDVNINAEWRDLEEQVNTFWKENLNRVFPFNPKGKLIASLRPHAVSSLFAALYNNRNTSPDNISPELFELLQKEQKSINQLGQSRIVERILTSNTRSIAYSYEDLDLDPRWQPQELHQAGILGLFMRAHNNTDIWHIQIPGHKSLWPCEAIDFLSQLLIRATLYDNSNAVPLPLWYAQQMVKFPKELLFAYREQINKELKPND